MARATEEVMVKAVEASDAGRRNGGSDGRGGGGKLK